VLDRCSDVPAPREDRTDDLKEIFYEELEPMFDKFPKYHTKMLIGDLSVQVGKEDSFKPTIENERLHENSNDNGVGVGNYATSENQVNIQCFHIVTFINLLPHLLMERLTMKFTIF
jgi:hypothetical protein